MVGKITVVMCGRDHSRLCTISSESTLTIHWTSSGPRLSTTQGTNCAPSCVSRLLASYTTKEPGNEATVHYTAVCAIILLLVSWSGRDKVRAGLFSKPKLLVILKAMFRATIGTELFISSLIIF